MGVNKAYWWIAVHHKAQGIANSFTTSYSGKALMWYTLITQRGEVSGFVRILHQVLGYHMTKHTVYIPPVHILPLHAMHAHYQYTDTTIVWSNTATK